MTFLKRLFGHNTALDRGATMVEYGLIVGVVALMSLSAVTLVGERTEQTFDEVSGALDGDGTTVAPVDDDQDGDADDDGSDGEQNEDPTPPPSDDPNPPEEEDENPSAPGENEDPEDEVQPEDTEQITPPEVSGSAASTDGWTWHRGRHRTDWDANVSYANSTGQAQNLTLLVTMVDENGNTTEKVEAFEVPANGSATFTQEGNPYDVNNGGNNESGTVRVDVQVVSMTTTGSDGQSQTVEVDQDPVSVEAPTP